MNEPLIQKTVTDTGYLVIEPRRIFAAVLVFARAKAAELTAGVLLAIMSFQMLSVISRKSITVDEIVMIPAAYYHLVGGNFQLVNEHPPLSKIIAATPLMFVQPNELRPDQLTAAPNTADAKWAYTNSFWEENKTQFGSISFWPRVPMILLTVLLGLLVFRFTRELFSVRAALLAVALFTLEPTVLAHGRVVQTDVPAALGYLLFFMALYSYRRQPGWRGAAWLGCAAGIAILAKYSMLLVGPILAGYFCLLLWQRARAKQRVGVVVIHATIVALTIYVLINAAYFFQHRAILEADLTWINQAFPAHPAVAITSARWLSHFLPADFVMGILFQIWHNRAGHSASLLGMYSQTGWWYYFPVAFALKTTLPFLILSLGALGWGSYNWIRNRDWRFAWLLIPFALYTVFVLFSHIDIGVRYYLPAYPFLFIIGAALLDKLLSLRRVRLAGVCVCFAAMGWIGIEAWRAYPNHMVHMNQIASRAPHWWYLSDSNVEWGDDLRELAKYLQEHGETRVRDATLGGFFALHYYGIDRVDAFSLPANDKTRYLAVGASYLNGSVIGFGKPGSGRETDQQRLNFFDEYRHRAPEAVIGNSIYVFRVQ